MIEISSDDEIDYEEFDDPTTEEDETEIEELRGRPTMRLRPRHGQNEEKELELTEDEDQEVDSDVVSGMLGNTSDFFVF